MKTIKKKNYYYVSIDISCKTYHHQRSLDCRQNINYQIIDDNEFRNRQDLFFRNGGDQRMVSHIWHKQNAVKVENNKNNAKA